MKYRAYLSYSHADLEWARWLHRALESYRPPRHLTGPDGKGVPKRLRPIFRDRDDLPSTASLSDATQAALAESETLVVICSPHAAASRWVNAEIRAFRELGRAHRILCFVIDGEPGSGDERECFPAELARGSASPDSGPPVAADARPEGDGRKNAMLKIAAGMLGVGFDSLKQRELRRRHRRMVATSAVSMLVATVTALLAISAILARNEADARRAQANDLIDFMLGDLQDQLREIGRLDIFQSVGDEALEYFASQRGSDDSSETLSQRARNLRQIGEIRMDQGALDEALEAFEESLLTMDRLVRRNPEDADARIDRANSLFYVGWVHWQRGELGEAREIFEQVLGIVEAVSAREPDNPSWLIELAYAYTNLGRVLELEGSYQQALVAYQGVMDVNQHLAELEPENEEWELELGFAHNNLGKLIVALGRLDEAEAHYRRDLEIKDRLYSEDRNNNLYRSYLGVSQYYLGELLTARGAYEEGERLLAAALDHFASLNEFDPDNLPWRARRANVERELAKLYEYTGQSVRSSALLESSITTLRELSQGNEANVVWRHDLVRALLVDGDFASRHQRMQQAERRIHEAMGHMEALLALDAVSLGTQALSIYADLCAARLAEGTLLTTDVEAVLARINRYFPGTADPWILELRAAALERLERYEEAGRIRGHLEAIGYRGHRL